MLVSLVVLGVAAVLQALVVVWSGSVALLGDTLHNIADALTAVPLAIAFGLGRRPANRRYTYGYGRAEDLAGVAVVVVVIVASAVFAAYEAVERLARTRRTVDHLVAVGRGRRGRLRRQRAGRALPDPGRARDRLGRARGGRAARPHRRVHLARRRARRGAASRSGWEQADPVVGLLITLAILACCATPRGRSTAG